MISDPVTAVATTAGRDARDAAIRVVGLTAWYGSAAGVRDIDLEFAANEITAIIGPSGCGKSSLLRSFNRMNDLIAGVRHRGEVRVGALDVKSAAQGIVNKLLGGKAALAGASGLGTLDAVRGGRPDPSASSNTVASTA